MTQAEPPSATSAELMAELYDELHQLASRERWRAGRPDTLQTTAVLHEAYLKLYTREKWGSRQHFVGAAVTTMRNLLVDAARARMAAKRGSGTSDLPMETARDIPADDLADGELIELGDALERLGRMNPDLAKVVDLRFFGGMTDRESAEMLGVTDRTVQRWWTQARAWIHSEIAGAG